MNMCLKTMSSSYLIILYFCALPFAEGLEEGDSCILNRTGQQGTCETIRNCPAALKEIKHQRFPQTCGFAGSMPRVCCVDGPPPTKVTACRTTTSRRNTPPTPITTKSPTFSSTNPYRPNDPGYKSFEKCVEYSKLVFTYKKPPILIIDKEIIKENTCGFREVPLTAATGGQPANHREFPHMALVGYESFDGIRWLCGGSLISETFILTAGHCLISTELGNASRVRLGVAEINNPSHRQDIKVIDWIRYPDYSPPSLYNDIGLLKLEKKVNFDIFVRPACLHNAKYPLGKSAIATGWGNTDFFGYSSDQLIKVILRLSDRTTCYNSYSKVSKLILERGIDDELMVCAGTKGKDTCQGDSGGPLQIYSPIYCMYEIVGVTSFGKACGLGNSPGVYTRVSKMYLRSILDGWSSWFSHNFNCRFIFHYLDQF